MEQAYEVIQPGEKTPRMHERPDAASAPVQALVAGQLVYVEATSVENAGAPDGWKHVTFRRTPIDTGQPGWIETTFIGPSHNFEVLPVPEVEFVQACARAEIAAGAGGTTGAPAILADYLIALAWIESELTNFENRLPGTSAIGPFQITQEEWADFLKDNPHSCYAPFQLYQALAQVAGAQYLTQRDWDALEEEAQAAGITEPQQVYVPSFLLLFQARLIGAKAAFAIDQIHASSELQKPIAEALAPFYPNPADLQALINRRHRFLRQGPAGDDTTVDEFVEKSANVLADGFKIGFSKLKQHFPEFAVPPVATTNPWLEKAKTEEAFWAQADVSETTVKGRDKIRAYFRATSYHPSTVQPWCGAFVAWCISQTGTPIVKEAATARSWKAWGTVELRKGGLTDPQVAAALPGAVVVLHPGTGTGITGHVCFALNRMETSNKLKCLGGNQSDTVRTDTFDLSRVATIRALAVVDSPGNDDLLVLARTIYGEARGERQQGREAVAEVVMNRRASNRYPNTVSGVCLDPSQFSCWNPTDPNRAKIIALEPNTGNSAFDQCFEVAQAALAGQIDHLSDKVLHYHADSISAPDWVRKSPKAFMERKIGRHLFYRGIA